jgi:hypothetical protein
LFQRAVNQITNQNGGRDIADIVTTEEDGSLSVSTAMLILKIHAEAIRRSVKLSPPSELYVDIINFVLRNCFVRYLLLIFNFTDPSLLVHYSMSY